VGRYLDRLLELTLGAPVQGYSRLGRAGMQQHLTQAHGMHPADFGSDFARPQSLAQWHGMDHVARPSLGPAHADTGGPSVVSHATHDAERAEHGGGGHGGGAGHALEHVLAGHMAAQAVHREGRRTADRQVRRRGERLIHRHSGKAGKPPGGASSGASGSSSGGSGSSSGGSGSSSGSSGGRGAGRSW
jgi:hypothetical protein